MFVYVPFGTYDVSVSSPGFGTKVTTGVLVTTASETTVDVELDVEAVAEQVSVTATVAQLETSDTTIGAAIEENLMRHAPIPVQGAKRKPYQYINLSPGVNNTNGRGNVAGSRTLNTVIMLDGLSTETDNRGVGEMARNTEPSVEAIGEYKLLLSNTSAEYGRTSGGLITYATKSGTNDFHGSVWNFHNNSWLNARRWQAAEPWKQPQQRIRNRGRWACRHSQGLQRAKQDLLLVDSGLLPPERHWQRDQLPDAADNGDAQR